MDYILETQRLGLREICEADFEVWYKILSDPETMRFYPAPFDADKVYEWINWQFDNYKKYNFGLWAVILKDTGEFIGDCGITMHNIFDKLQPEVGYHIKKDYCRKGYATEAAKKCLEYAFEKTNYNEVFSTQKYTNIPSRGVALKMGMTLCGEYPSKVNTFTSIHSITREQFNKLYNK